MKKALVLLLTAFLFLSLFVSCSPDPVVEITISFDGNGSTSGEMPDQTVVRGEGFALPDNTFKKTGYEFMGWNTEADGSGTNYPDGYFVSFIENTTLYAQWSFNGVAEIRFEANGGEGTMLPQWVIKGVETVLNQNKYSKEDFYFVGWNTKADGTGDTYSDADTATFEDDTTLYAQWYKEVVEIRFDANGGGGLMFPQWVQIGVATALKPNRFSWKGHYFTGWNTKADGSGTKYDDKAKITTETGAVLYAQWIMDVSTMDDKTRWNESDGKYFTISADVAIDDRVEVSGDIILLLPEGKTLNAKRGINVSTGNSITIDGKGTLKATGGNYQSGIGGGCDESCGTVTINGGNVNATGGSCGAGIGGGRGGDEGGYGGTVNITGGNVKATGGDNASGIGGGSEGNGGSVSISGKTTKVAATGGFCGAGIGGGYDGSAGSVTIAGGTLTANGGSDAAGIGGGYLRAGGEVIISGGTVTATGGGAKAAGIGGGSCGGVSGAPGKLTIGYAEIQSNSLVINTGWSLYYGDSEKPSDHVDGPHDANDFDSYAKKCMSVTKPAT